VHCELRERCGNKHTWFALTSNVLATVWQEYMQKSVDLDQSLVTVGQALAVSNCEISGSHGGEYEDGSLLVVS
jgi:hypothetical protein